MPSVDEYAVSIYKTEQKTDYLAHFGFLFDMLKSEWPGRLTILEQDCSSDTLKL